MEYRQGSHTRYKIEYHFVWVTKYLYHVLQGDLALRVRELERQTCERFEIHLLRGVASKDHVHILVSAPPNISPLTLCEGSKAGCRVRFLRNSHMWRTDAGVNISGREGISASRPASLLKIWFKSILSIISRKTQWQVWCTRKKSDFGHFDIDNSLKSLHPKSSFLTFYGTIKFDIEWFAS